MVNTIKLQYDDHMRLKTPIEVLCRVHDGCMIELAKVFSENDYKVALHNFANNERPGLFQTAPSGKVYFNENTQEEQILKRTMKRNHIPMDLALYPITTNLETPCALVDKSVVFYDPARRVRIKDFELHALITCALPRAPVDDDEIILRHMILVIAAAMNVSADYLITGPWGAGAFGHSMERIVTLWRKAITLTNSEGLIIYFCFKFTRNQDPSMLKTYRKILLSPQE